MGLVVGAEERRRAELVVEVFRRVFSAAAFHRRSLRAVLLSTIDLCNQKIYEDSRSLMSSSRGWRRRLRRSRSMETMATVAHVGDSRVYQGRQPGVDPA
jgi:serine/threonine protein phosphatase PrpC